MVRLEQLKRVLALAVDMASLAKDYRWDELVEKESQERALVLALRTSFGAAPPSPDEKNIAEQILAQHAFILEIAAPLHDSLAHLINAWRSERPEA